MSALRAAAALAAALAAAPAAAYVRTRGTTGVDLAWRVPVVPWTLSRRALDAGHIAPSCRAGPAGDPALDAVVQSFATWEQPCAELQLPFAGTIPELRVGALGTTENLVVFREGWCSRFNDPACADPEVDCAGIHNCFQDNSDADKRIVALTSVLYDPRTGRIYDADIEINGWDGERSGSIIGSPPMNGWYFTCHEPADPPNACARYGEPDCDYIDLRNTVTHEAGHFVGLAHPCGDEGQPSCTPEELARTMAPNTIFGETSKRTLSDDDVAGVCAIYPPSGGGCGCGSGGAPGLVALAIAAAALLRRRVPS